jgi:hypothetical protein
MRRALAILAIVALVCACCGAGLASGETRIVGGLQLSVEAKLSPRKLPRQRKAPVAVSVGWKIASTDPTQRPPALKTVQIQINRGGVLDTIGLPDCPYGKIQPASTQRALANCRPSLIGRGSFSAQVGLEGQESYSSQGEMVLFKSTRAGKPVLYGQIYTSYPFAASFVIVFGLSEQRKGTFGTTLTAKLPANLRAWGNLTEVKMRLARSFHFKGERHSFLSASCPAPKGFSKTPFRLAKTSFAFAGGTNVSQTLSETCRARD